MERHRATIATHPSGPSGPGSGIAAVITVAVSIAVVVVTVIASERSARADVKQPDGETIPAVTVRISGYLNGSTNNHVAGNFIGTDQTGTVKLGQAGGIFINNGKGASIDMVGPSVAINKLALVVT